MKDFIETVPQPRRRVVEGKREVGNSICLRVAPEMAGLRVRAALVRTRDGARWRYGQKTQDGDIGDFCFDATTLRNLAAACTELADVLDEQKEDQG